jgi:hypothetical protein
MLSNQDDQTDLFQINNFTHNILRSDICYQIKS